MKTLEDFELAGKRVLVRCDFNVPIDDAGIIVNDAKIRDALLTLQYLLEQQAKIIIITHLGKPEGNVVESLRLNVIKDTLENLLGNPVKYITDCVGPMAQEAVAALQPGHILLLENVRFHQEEMDNDSEFAKHLAELGEIYINEAFDVCHRAHASVSAITQFLPHGAGLSLQNEVETLYRATQRPTRPMMTVIGGAKAETKAPLVEGFCAFADFVIVNGLIKQELIDKKIPLSHPEKVIGPRDNLKALDISEPDTERIIENLAHARTIIWNGPFGKFEEEEYKQGTLAIANAIIKSGAYSVVGGGETIEFLQKEGILDKFSHVCTAGGAMLAYVSGQEMPGLKALE